MIVIESTNAKGWRWLAGVFAEQHAAAAFLNAIPEQERHYQKTVVLAELSYPFFVIETRGFEYGDLAFVKGRLSALVPAGDEDAIHLNVYAVLEDFAPSPPGTDQMGGLLHWHITDYTLSEPRAGVFAQELASIAGDA